MIQIVSKYSNYLEELPELIKKSPYKTAYIIEKLQIPKATYYRKLKDKSFSVEEVEKLTRILFPTETYLMENNETLADSREEVQIGKYKEYEKLMERVIKGVS